MLTFITILLNSVASPGGVIFNIERLAPECGHRVEVDTVDQNAVDAERHAVILAATQRALVHQSVPILARRR